MIRTAAMTACTLVLVLMIGCAQVQSPAASPTAASVAAPKAKAPAPAAKPVRGEARTLQFRVDGRDGHAFVIREGAPAAVQGKGGFLGVAVEPVPPLLVNQFDLGDGRGLLVGQVLKDSAAAKAGVEAGDVLTHVGDQIIYSDEQLRKLVAANKPGDKIKVTVIHKAKSVTRSVELGKAPAAQPMAVHFSPGPNAKPQAAKPGVPGGPQMHRQARRDDDDGDDDDDHDRRDGRGDRGQQDGHGRDSRDGRDGHDWRSAWQRFAQQHHAVMPGSRPGQPKQQSQPGRPHVGQPQARGFTPPGHMQQQRGLTPPAPMQQHRGFTPPGPMFNRPGQPQQRGFGPQTRTFNPGQQQRGFGPPAAMPQQRGFMPGQGGQIPGRGFQQVPPARPMMPQPQQQQQQRGFAPARPGASTPGPVGQPAGAVLPQRLMAVVEEMRGELPPAAFAKLNLILERAIQAQGGQVHPDRQPQQARPEMRPERQPEGRPEPRPEPLRRMPGAPERPGAMAPTMPQGGPPVKVMMFMNERFRLTATVRGDDQPRLTLTNREGRAVFENLSPDQLRERLPKMEGDVQDFVRGALENMRRSAPGGEGDRPMARPVGPRPQVAPDRRDRRRDDDEDEDDDD
ncbi:MAG: hypothetical protein BIFFINMI_01660 [Phycisphaerae bacterium]|nr:hypothetical protein [Phycisphaerae bacterium]